MYLFDLFLLFVQYFLHMETIPKNSVILNLNDGDESTDSTPGDTTVVTTKNDNDELMVDDSITEEAGRRTQDILNNEGCVICDQSSPPLNNSTNNTYDNSKYNSAVILTCRGINSDCLYAIHCTCMNNGALTKNFVERYRITIVANGMSLTMNHFHQHTRGVTLNANAKASRVLQMQFSVKHVVSSTRQKAMFIGDMHAVQQTKYVSFACVLV